MKTNTMPSIIQIEKEKLNELVKEVKETIATDVTFSRTTPKQKKFGIIDLWNCQRNVRTAVSMRRY